MKLATFKTAQGESHGGNWQGLHRRFATLPGQPVSRSQIAHRRRRARPGEEHLTETPDYKTSDITWLPVIPNPDKIVCVGLNYQEHVVETGRDNTEQPAIFLRLPESQVGHLQPIVRPRESTNMDFEAEIAVIIGKPAAHFAEGCVAAHRRLQLLQRRLGARLAAPHHPVDRGQELRAHRRLRPVDGDRRRDPAEHQDDAFCRLNGERMQHATTEQMIFKIPKIIEYVSTWTTLVPGDVLVTGTPGGVGARRTPPIWMKPGDKVEIEIDKVGVLENSIADG